LYIIVNQGFICQMKVLEFD